MSVLKATILIAEYIEKGIGLTLYVINSSCNVEGIEFADELAQGLA